MMTSLGDQFLKFFRKDIPDLQIREKIAVTFAYHGEPVTWYFDNSSDVYKALDKVRYIRSTYWDYPSL